MHNLTNDEIDAVLARLIERLAKGLIPLVWTTGNVELGGTYFGTLSTDKLNYTLHIRGVQITLSVQSDCFGGTTITRDARTWTAFEQIYGYMIAINRHGTPGLKEKFLVSAI